MAHFILVLAALSVAVSACGQTASERSREVVRELGQFPASLPASGRSIDPAEEKRQRLYGELIELGDRAIPAIARGLVDPNVQIRRNVALFLNVASMKGGFYPSKQALDAMRYLGALIIALEDDDDRVRGLAAQTIGNIGPKAASAVPALVTLLANSSEGSRNGACIGLYGIGPAAREALPALRQALSDPSADVRRFAQRAIDQIDVPR